MRVLLDTNRLTDALRGEKSVVRLLEEADEVWIPFIALAEAKAGFLVGSRRGENEALLLALMNQPGVAALYADRETTESYARLYMHLRQEGKPIPTNDLWIASLAVQHQLILLTRDEHFDRLPQVART